MRKPANGDASVASAENKKRAPNRWPKGVSGNPGGRPRGAGEVRELARQHGPEAIEKLAQLMRSRDPSVAVAACKALLDRGYGKPEQSISLANGGALVNVNLNGPIVTAEQAAAAYAAMCGDPSLSIEGLTFAAAEPPQREHVAEAPILEVARLAPPPGPVQPLGEIQEYLSTGVTSDRVEPPASDDMGTWERLGEIK